MHVRRCANCLISETFPGIVLNEDGVCNHCVDYSKNPRKEEIIAFNRQKIEDAIAAVRGKQRYDVALAYSGGKDSSYTLHLLRTQYHLEVFALMVDNDFTAPEAFVNARIMADACGADLVIFKPDAGFMRRMYKRSIEGDVYNQAQLSRANAACLSCINVINGIVLNEAILRSIPLVAGGYIGGQIPERSGMISTSHEMFRDSRKGSMRMLADKIDPAIARYTTLPDKDFAPTLINPLMGLDYDEHAILETLHAYGWRKPKNTGKSSSNCLLNDYAIAKHYEKHHFHSYEAEICLQVRHGTLSREEALGKLEDIRPSSSYTTVLERLQN